MEKPFAGPDSGDTCTCWDCGYQWRRMTSGTHDCARQLRELIASRAALDVLAERSKQRKRWGDAHDDAYDGTDLPTAAMVLLDPDHARAVRQAQVPGWATVYRQKHAEDRRRQLVIGVALALAEIERLDRAEGRR